VFLIGYLKVAVFLASSLVMVSFAAITFGRQQPSDLLLRGLAEGCRTKPQPCWYGIVPGVSTLDEMDTYLRAAQSDAETRLQASAHTDSTYQAYILQAEQNSCRVLVTLNRFSSLVDSIVFDTCTELQPGRLRRFIRPIERTFFTICGRDNESLEISYSFIHFLVDNAPPQNSTQVNVLILENRGFGRWVCQVDLPG
jgi:hypothetical protein